MNKLSSLWIYLGIVVVSFNWLVIGSVGIEQAIISISIIVIYYLCRICEILENNTNE
jgi:hypothetical protein